MTQRDSRRAPALMLGLAFGLVPASGCYHGERATRDVNAAWAGRTRSAIEARWGKPASVEVEGSRAVLRWSHRRVHFELPAAQAELIVEPGRVEGTAALHPGAVWHSSTEVVVLVDAGGTITSVRGPSLRWGPPNDANLRWGTILGQHVGMGRLDDTSTPLPSGGAYVGGMLSPTLGLAGTFSLVSGLDDAGGAMGFSWGMAAVWWPATRVSLRGGPALVLAFDPGFANVALGPGLTGSASLALIKAGTFVLDLRLDLTTASSGAFGNLGIGVNMN
jgi:hypothetical protein